MPNNAHALITSLRRRLLSETGQSLAEVLIAATITVVVLGAIGTLLVSSQRQQQKNANYDYAQSNAQVELDGMVAQIRDAWNIVSWGPNFVDMDVNIGSTPYQVYYECDVPAGTGSWNKCVRLQFAVSATTVPSLAGATTVVPYISNGTTADPVFSWQSEATAPAGSGSVTTVQPNALAPDYFTATLKAPASNGAPTTVGINRTIVYSDGGLIRNLDVEN